MVKATSSGLGTSRPYVKILRPFRFDPTQCEFCEGAELRCSWITKNAELTLLTMVMDVNCKTACEDCMREMGLLW